MSTFADSAKDARSPSQAAYLSMRPSAVRTLIATCKPDWACSWNCHFRICISPVAILRYDGWGLKFAGFPGYHGQSSNNFGHLSAFSGVQLYEWFHLIMPVRVYRIMCLIHMCRRCRLSQNTHSTAMKLDFFPQATNFQTIWISSHHQKRLMRLSSASKIVNAHRMTKAQSLSGNPPLTNSSS